MPTLRVQKDFQLVRKLPFCYLCGRDFVDGDEVNADHVPPKCTFNARDREPALKLQTHKECNSAESIEDNKVGQLIALRRFESPRPERQVLKFGHYGNMVAVENLNIDAAVWRWVRGFHAALYRQPLVQSANRAIQTPFPRAQKTFGGPVVVPIRQQHVLSVDVIKRNRVVRNLDRVYSNKDQLRYECVWAKGDESDWWICIFALDIYDWKDLGSHTAEIPARGCTGMYVQQNRSVPEGATLDAMQIIAVPNQDVLDPFAP
jgi:hypothetical protein